MALIERIMGVNDDGSYDPAHRSSDKIPVHVIYASMQEVLGGRLAGAVFKSHFSIRVVADDSGRSDQDDLAAIIAAMPASGTVARSLYLNSVHSIFLLAEYSYKGVRMPGYTTPALVRAKLGI